MIYLDTSFAALTRMGIKKLRDYQIKKSSKIKRYCKKFGFGLEEFISWMSLRDILAPPLFTQTKPDQVMSS